MTAAAMTPDEITALLRAGFLHWDKTGVTIEAVGYRSCRLRLAVGDHSLRMGGTVSGPTMFMLADTALYVAVLASIGPKGLAVTTNMSINFLKKPPPRDLIADCRLLKLGKRLAVGEATIFSEGEDDPVAHAAGTYSIPGA
ncbi:MAG: PaaI family thioesterase [Pseudomonadota bacterium]